MADWAKAWIIIPFQAAMILSSLSGGGRVSRDASILGRTMAMVWWTTSTGTPSCAATCVSGRGVLSTFRPSRSPRGSMLNQALTTLACSGGNNASTSAGVQVKQ